MGNTVSILGCGWYGYALAKALVSANYTVKGSTTTPDKLNTLKQAGINPFLVNFDGEPESYNLDFFNCDTLIISLPPRRSSEQYMSIPLK